MTPITLLSHLKKLGISLWVDEGNLRYKAPQGTLDNELREEIRKHKPQLLQILNADSHSGTPNPLVPQHRNTNLPLSFAQQRLWFLHQLEPESAAYHVPLTWRLSGPLDVGALQQSIQVVVDRHESLRTSFPMVANQPIQVITPSLTVPFRQEDLQAEPEKGREEKTQSLIHKEIARPFDLATGPVLRVFLLCLDKTDHILVLTLHHIVSDGWSIGILYRELEACYVAIAARTVPTLTPLPIQYADFAIWQRNWLQGEVLDAQMQYWCEQLADLTPLAFPTDFVRPPIQKYQAACQEIFLPPRLQQALHILSQDQGCTNATTLLAAFMVLLAKYTGQTDLVVGMPIANRNRQEIEGLIGFFVNSLVIRTDATGNPTFQVFIDRVQATTLSAYDHQDVPFERIVEELQPERDTSRNPLFQVLFAVQNAKNDGLQLPGFTISRVTTASRTTRMDFECHIREHQDGLFISILYRRDLFTPNTMEQFGRHYQCVLEEVVRDPTQRLSQIPILNEAERRHLLEVQNATTAAYPHEASLPRLFEAQVNATPESIAVTYEDKHLTYAQLNACANQVAHALQRHGVGPEVLVGICCERSLNMLVGLLGILKAGGAYVPLDPDYPTDRLAFMLAEAQAPVLLTTPSVRLKLPAYSGIIVDLDGSHLSHESSDNLAPIPTPEHLAYVLYTSGSTGQPKGVAVCHRTLTNLVTWQMHTQQSFPRGSTLQFASLSFDVSCQEIFSTLVNGGRLLLIPEATRRDFQQLLDVLTRENVERIFLPFVALQQLILLARNQGHLPLALKEVISAGEQLKVSETMVQLIKDQAKGVLVNQYGPSESHVVTSFALSNKSAQWPALPAIGDPIANTQIYVLDSQRELVPIGVPGELYIGGIGLARGYVNKPALTAQNFVPHPFSRNRGMRLYQTGDRARFQHNGKLEFLGRSDHQVKLRGYRIELGEVEVALTQDPSVKDAVVLCREDRKDDKQLVAYVTENSGPLNMNTLRKSLGKQLPEYMLPSIFVVLKTFPLTPNGKVDRQSLPMPDQTHRVKSETYVPPESPTEELLADVWQNLLNVKKVGRYDNFFELGGHSLLATQLIAQLFNQHEIQLSLRSLFDHPKLMDLAQVVTEQLLQEMENFSQSQHENPRSPDQPFEDVP